MNQIPDKIQAKLKKYYNKTIEPEGVYDSSTISNLGTADLIIYLESEYHPLLENLPAKGIKKVLVFSPAFTSDCLETVIEIGDEYEELFIKAGGQTLDYVPSLNFSDAWVQAIIDITNSK